MFIAVSKSHKNEIDQSKVCVFDTKDCTMETVSLSTIQELGIKVSNIMKGNPEYYLIYNNILNHLSSSKDFVWRNNNTLYVGDMRVNLVVFDGNIKSINDRLLYIHDGKLCINAKGDTDCPIYRNQRIILSSITLHRGSLVFFMHFDSKGWTMEYVDAKAVIHPDGSVDIWTSDYATCTNKALAAQIDTIYGW